MNIETNLQLLRRSRPRLRPGDVFAMLMPGGRYLYGRVIAADLPDGKAPVLGANLIYIYDAVQAEKLPAPLESLMPDRLLIAPFFTNRLGWTRGVFENIEHHPLGKTDLLPQHCFWDVTRRLYCDETGEPIAARAEPCGEWGLGSYRMIDDLVSDALGIPRVPVQEG